MPRKKRHCRRSKRFLRPRRVDSQTVSSSVICGIFCCDHGACNSCPAPSTLRTDSWAGAARGPLRGRKEDLPRRIYRQGEGSAKGVFLSSPLVWSAALRQTFFQLRRIVLPNESGRSYESSVITAEYPTDDGRRNRLRIYASRPEKSL